MIILTIKLAAIILALLVAGGIALHGSKTLAEANTGEIKERLDEYA